MEPQDPDAAPPPLPEGRQEGRAQFSDLVRQAFATAATEGWKHIVVCDGDFADWPLGEREVVASLNAWAKQGRTLHMIARQYRTLREQQPRFVQWRVTWAHLFEARACAGASVDELPSLLWSPGWTMERLDAVRGVCVASRDPSRRVALQENLEGWWIKGTPGFPASVLGL